MAALYEYGAALFVLLFLRSIRVAEWESLQVAGVLECGSTGTIIEDAMKYTE